MGIFTPAAPGDAVSQMPAAATQCRNIGANRTTAGGHAKFAPGPAVPTPGCPSNEALYWNSSMTSPILI